MLSQRVLEQINGEWLQQSDQDYSFMVEVIICKELGELLKTEGFEFEFNPNTFNEYEGEDYYNIPIIIDDIDNLIQFKYE
jgi:hypothetical protein